MNRCIWWKNTYRRHSFCVDFPVIFFFLFVKNSKLKYRHRFICYIIYIYNGVYTFSGARNIRDVRITHYYSETSRTSRRRKVLGTIYIVVFTRDGDAVITYCRIHICNSCTKIMYNTTIMRAKCTKVFACVCLFLYFSRFLGYLLIVVDLFSCTVWDRLRGRYDNDNNNIYIVITIAAVHCEPTRRVDTLITIIIIIVNIYVSRVFRMRTFCYFRAPHICCSATNVKHNLCNNNIIIKRKSLKYNILRWYYENSDFSAFTCT